MPPPLWALKESLAPLSLGVTETYRQQEGSTLIGMTATLSRIREQAEAACGASRALGVASTAAKNAALERIATLLVEREDEILAENERDLVAGRQAGLDEYLLERLTLTSSRIRGMATDTLHIASLPDPVGETIEARTLPNGLQISRKRVPLGVIACIYESRPNVTIDIAALCLKSGNAAVLRGGKEAVCTNAALGDLLRDALKRSELSVESVQVVRDPDRAQIDELLGMHDVIDLVVPRGSAGLIDHVRETATMPVVAHGEAVSHTYVDEKADLGMAVAVVDNAKTRRYSICNALDTLLVHASIASELLDSLGKRWAGAVTLLGDPGALEVLEKLKVPGLAIEPADSDAWDTEHLALRAGVLLVHSMDEALAHIEAHSSRHSEAIITDSYENAMRFTSEVDAAVVYVNASTQFTDGAQFGLGAEIGISTQKMHARGPMGLVELTSYKWMVFGAGQIRPA